MPRRRERRVSIRPAVEAIRLAQPPVFADDAEAEVYEFARQLQQTGTVEPACMPR